jgi:ribonuclease HI
MSYSWQSIKKASWILKKHCIWNIGNGEKTSIWEDNWVQPLVGGCIWSKRPENTPYQLVSDLIDNQNKAWKEEVIKQIFYPMEAKLICSMALPNYNQEDFISWKGTKDGHYSVKSGYQAILAWQEAQSPNPSSSNMDNTRWKKLWKLFVPPKQIHHIWRILNNAIPVRENLSNKGIRCDPLCPLCNSKIETINHIFLECEWTRQIWFVSPLTINYEFLQIKTISSWFDYMMQNTTAIDMQTISTILYGIWIARNEKVYKDKHVPPTEVVNRALKNLHEFQSHQGSKALAMNQGNTRHNNGWSPPPKGSLKLNVDAHSLSDGHWGLGLVLRQEDGNHVGAATRVRKGTDCVLLAEAMGLQEAMDIADRWQLQNTIIELDAKVIVDTIHSGRNPRTNWGCITTRCREWLKEKQNITVVWTKRSGNNVAYELAKWAAIEPNKDWGILAPYCILLHIQKDVSLLKSD